MGIENLLNIKVGKELLTNFLLSWHYLLNKARDDE
jgi:hypothetical protein